jgi:hypothetical protein
MVNKLRFGIKKSYKKLKTNRLYLSLKKTRLKKIYQLIQKTHSNIKRDLGENTVLHEDFILKEIFKFIGDKFKVTSIVETGTFLGHTTKFLANAFLNKKIYTCELLKSNYIRAKKNLKKNINVRVFNADSTYFLNKISLSLLGKRPLFYLDAHGEGCPIEKEISFIFEKFKTAIIIIDDFKINNDIFQFNTYEEKEISINLISSNKNKKSKYNLLYPHYTEKDAFRGNEGNLVGYAIVFQGLEKEFKEAIKHPFICKFFIDKSEFLK